MDNQTIGEQLRAAMAAKGLSENELSRQSGVPFLPGVWAGLAVRRHNPLSH